MILRFILYGFLGWGLEVFWTGINSIKNGDRTLKGNSSLWMFPIYGTGVFLEPIMSIMLPFPIVLRGVVYMLCIFIVEYASGTVLKKYAACPWDYSMSVYSVNGVIRLDYAPIWFSVGLIYEFIYKTLLIKI